MPAPSRAVAILGVPALYFTLLTSGWGATLGKRLLGVRVVRLDAERLSLLESFERFTGYLHIPALLAWPIFDLWRKPNRQLPHHRTVHTVVVRSQPAAVKPAAPEPIADAPAAPRCQQAAPLGTTAPAPAPRTPSPSGRQS